METREFTIGFGEQKTKMRIGVIPNSTYKLEIDCAKERYRLIKESDYLCTLDDEGIRVTLINGDLLEQYHEEIKSELIEIWGGETNGVFSILYETLKSINKIKGE